MRSLSVYWRIVFNNSIVVGVVSHWNGRHWVVEWFPGLILEDFVYVCLVDYFNEMLRLMDANAIETRDNAECFYADGHFVVYFCYDFVGCGSCFATYREVVDLSKEKDWLTVV